jgi:hypothetical protein
LSFNLTRSQKPGYPVIYKYKTADVPACSRL